MRVTGFYKGNSYAPCQKRKALPVMICQSKELFHWRLMGADYSTSATITHSLDIKDVIGKQFSYQCLCSTHQLTICRHNKVLKGAKYLCKRCRGELKATSAEGIDLF